jgi:hypothetical protein
MARKQETFVPTDGRDKEKGQHYLITEMPALKAERWAVRALLALAHAGVQMPDGAESAGMAAIAHAGLQSLQNLDFEEARPLLDEMWTCVSVIPDPKKNPSIQRPLVMNEMEGDDIEEITTMWKIREAIFRLHTAFFLRGK